MFVNFVGAFVNVWMCVHACVWMHVCVCACVCACMCVFHLFIVMCMHLQVCKTYILVFLYVASYF